jgi:hypothetical protein
VAALTSAGGADIYAAKYSPDGTHAWSKRFGGTSDDFGESVTADAAGNVVIGGSFRGTANFGGGDRVSLTQDLFVASYDENGVYRWSHTTNGIVNSVAIDAAANVTLTGMFAGTTNLGGDNLVSAGAYDVLLARFGGQANPIRRASWTDLKKVFR